MRTTGRLSRGWSYRLQLRRVWASGHRCALVGAVLATSAAVLRDLQRLCLSVLEPFLAHWLQRPPLSRYSELLRVFAAYRQETAAARASEDLTRANAAREILLAHNDDVIRMCREVLAEPFRRVRAVPGLEALLRGRSGEEKARMLRSRGKSLPQYFELFWNFTEPGDTEFMSKFCEQ